MQSFRTELEDPIVQQDIIDLERKIYAFQNGQIDPERFRSLRLARGVYGQRQEGVQMVRIKIPFGKITPRQLHRIADISEQYGSGNLHITTRQDVQIHYVKLDDTPQLWAELEQDQITLREACGNTVRNITGSPMAGIDPREPFDVSPYAEAVFKYFLRNPICQDMGRKFKIAFSASDADDNYAYVHDLGFIPRLQDGERGFKVLLGGGIGAQPYHAEIASEFLPIHQLIPFTEAVLRVFDHYGERAKRHKARLKYLLQDVGLEGFLQLVQEQWTTLAYQSYPIEVPEQVLPAVPALATMASPNGDASRFERWHNANVLPQKQDHFFAVGIKLTNGDLEHDTAHQLATLLDNFPNVDLRLTIEQNILLRFVHSTQIYPLFKGLEALGLAAAGYKSPLDIVACPGTDTCNLGIASSMGLARELERLLEEEFPQLANNKDLIIKISGCMNACAQHTLASIGFQGMTIKVGNLVAPASQLLLGGGNLGNGKGIFADKVLKLPAKRSPMALRRVLQDYLQHQQAAETFADYYQRQGADYFYQMLKDLSLVDNLQPEDFIDWGNEADYVKAIGVGECAGVTVDLVATLLLEADEKWENAQLALTQGRFADSIYWSFTAILYGAKGLLTPTDAVLSSQHAILKSFDEHFHDTFDLGEPLSTIALRMRAHAPSHEFASQYLDDARLVLGKIQQIRQIQLLETA